jgi:ureidoglycolate lyase
MSGPLAPEPLRGPAFAPFGQVIEAGAAPGLAINAGTSQRFSDLATIAVGAGGGRPSLSIVQARPHPLPLVIAMLERHPLGSQAFIPLDAAEWLVVVAEGGAAPDPASLRVFRAGPRQGINFAPGVWHHPLLVLADRQDFLIVDRAGPGDNLELADLAEPVPVDLGRPR